MVRVGELFKPALQRNAASILIAHNHPSTDPTPSPEDISVTRAIVEAGKILDISVLDHLVIGLSAGFPQGKRVWDFRNSQGENNGSNPYITTI